MKRTKHDYSIPDAINCQPQQEFTQISNEFLRNPTISSKAKVALSILLGNREGWKSFIRTLTKFMKEGEETIRAAVKELERNGYLVRFNYRDKKTKQWKGWLWAYTNNPNDFNLQDSFALLDQHGMEIPNLRQRLRQKISPKPNFPEVGNPKLGILRTNNINVNNINVTTSSEMDEVRLERGSNGYITSSDFEEFWKEYPSNRKGSKGQALTKWEVACRSPHRPTMNRVRRALKKQKNSQQWLSDNGKWIPLITTWIHQKRWLDDPNQMKDWSKEGGSNDQIDKAAHQREWERNFGYDKEI